VIKDIHVRYLVGVKIVETILLNTF